MPRFFAGRRQDHHGDYAYLIFAEESDVLFMSGKLLFVERTHGVVERVTESLDAMDDAVELSGPAVLCVWLVSSSTLSPSSCLRTSATEQSATSRSSAFTWRLPETTHPAGLCAEHWDRYSSSVSVGGCEERVPDCPLEKFILSDVSRQLPAHDLGRGKLVGPGRRPSHTLREDSTTIQTGSVQDSFSLKAQQLHPDTLPHGIHRHSPILLNVFLVRLPSLAQRRHHARN